jgi:Abnormal spindle-like microcephaly-assoc'd, ASPM-SPD-2-Hydin/Beta-propeller repeat
MKSSTQSTFGLVAAIAVTSCLLCTAQTTPANRMTPQNPNFSRQVQANYGQLPLAFEANKGQTDPRVNFVSRGTGYSVFLTSGGMVLSLRPQESVLPVVPVVSNGASKTQPTSNKIASSTADTTMIFNLVGAAANPKAIGEEPLSTKVNYFIGSDPNKWQTNVQTYAKVRYQNVYPGIDLLYYGNNRQVEYDFIVAPGSDANKIQFSVTGADSLAVDAAGNLVLTKGTNQLHFQTPAIYQEANGTRVKVPGNYSLKDNTHVGFTVAPHDNSKTLVIDPVLVYSTFLGGRSYDQGSAIAVDAIGNAYVTGTTTSPDFPLATLGSLNPTQQRMFVVKLDVSGSTLLFADYFGGTSGNDSPSSIAIDSGGSAYVAGQAYSADFSILNAYQPARAGYLNAFLTKFSADGASLVYSTYLGGNSADYAQAVAVDSAGEATIAGYASSQNFPLASPYQSSISPDQNSRWGQYSFFSRFSADGSSLIYSSYLAGNLLSQNNCYNYCAPYTNINGLALDNSGNLYVVGNTNTVNFPTTSGAYLQTYPGTYESWVPFISKFDTSGAIVYSSYFGGTNYSYANAVAVDATGFAYVTGYDGGNDSFPITATTICDPLTQSCNGAFITKFDTAGANLAYSTYLGPNNNSQGVAIQVDAAGDAYVVGNIYSSQFTTVNQIESYTGGQDLLLVEIDPTASTQLFATFVGEDQDESVAGMALDRDGAMYVTGNTNSTFFPVTQSAFQSSWGGQNDAFILKIGPATASAVAIGPSLLQFSTLNVGVASPPRSTILRNMGTAPLNIATKILTGDFAETDDCGISVAAGSFCTFTVTFTPTAPGSRFGTIVLGDDASGSPHVINLVGDGSSPIVTLSPLTLTFSSLPVGQTSAVQIITLSNTGNATLNIASILATGNFAATSTCVSALAFGSSCQIQVTVTPTVGGAVTGFLTLTDDAPDSPQTIALSGSGYVTNGTFLPSIIAFANTAVGSTSGPQAVTVTNTGSIAMTVSAVTVTGAFGQTNTCSSIPANGTCTISVTFVPTTSGAQNGTLTLNDNAQGNPHSVSLSGTGVAGAAQLSASNLTFSALTVGTMGSAQTITVTNSGNGALTVAGIQATGDFAQTNNCASVAANSGTCTIQVTFTPTSSGTRSGTLTLTDSAVNSPQLVSLTGSGIDFSMSAAGGSDTIKAGATASYSMSITPVGGTFASAVTLVCAGAPAFSTCTVNPTSVTPGANPSVVTVTLKTAGTAAQLSAPGAAPSSMVAFWTLSTGFGLFGMFLIGTTQGRKRASILLLLIVLTAGVLFSIGCGSTSSPAKPTPATNSTPAGNYTVVVIGTSGSVKHFTSLTLTVQ